MRLFIGLPPPPSAAESTAQLADRCAAVIPGRYSLAENYHITLAFLGEVPPEQLEEAKSALSAFAKRFPAPRLTLEQIAYFRHPSNAVLIRSVQSPDDLPHMHRTLCALLDAHVLPHTDGPFSPHVTLARHADLFGIDPASLHAPCVSFTAPHAALYLSARDEQDVLRYTPLFCTPFVKSI